MSNLNSIKNNESTNQQNKSSRFIENAKRSVRKTLTTAWITASTMRPTSTTAIPANASNSIRIEPATSITIKTIWQWTTSNLFTTFDEKDNKFINNEILKNNQLETTFKTTPSEIDATKWKSKNNTENSNSSINKLGYKSIEINNIKPEEILPIVWRDKIQAWDKDVYKHIEHLRIAETTRIRDMMRKYGAGNHSPEEYQNLMNRLNTGMIWESPEWYNNYEIIWWNTSPSEHAHTERHILNTLINYANFKVANTSIGKRDFDDLLEFIQAHPNDINIFWCSATPIMENKSDCDGRSYTKDLFNSKNFIIFSAWTNIENPWWIRKNKIYNEEYEADNHWIYSLASLSNSNKDTQPNTHLLVTIATNKDGNIDQTDVDRESSKYPVWFKDNVLFSWRWFPQHREWVIYWPWWRYTTSDTNYFNVALASILFQLKADTPDTDQLLEMIRSTALTDYIKLDLNEDGDTNDNYQGQTENQPLLLINPAWFFQKYLMPTNLPTSIKTDENITLEKGFYHGVIFQIPGAEVNINGQWIPFTDENKSLILTQNPMNLKWRLNGNLLNNYNYKPWDTINGQIVVVDDKWNGLNITKDFSINIEDANGINDTKITTSDTSNTRYTIDGIRLDTKPTKPGIYIVNGQKVIIK